MADYVPYEKRERRQRAERDAAERRAADMHHARVADVMAVLGNLGGRNTNSHLEILRPAKGPRRFFENKPIVTKPHVSGGPDFVIGEVLSAYRIVGGIVKPAFADVSESTYDAYVTPDGRTWSFLGRGETSDTWQLLLSNEKRLEDLRTAHLERIAAGLRRF